MSVGSSNSTGAKSPTFDEFTQREIVTRFIEKAADHAAHIGWREGDLAKGVKAFRMTITRFIPLEVLEEYLGGPSGEADTAKAPAPLPKRRKRGPSGTPDAETDE